MKIDMSRARGQVNEITFFFNCLRSLGVQWLALYFHDFQLT